MVEWFCILFSRRFGCGPSSKKINKTLKPKGARVYVLPISYPKRAASSAAPDAGIVLELPFVVLSLLKQNGINEGRRRSN